MTTKLWQPCLSNRCKLDAKHWEALEMADGLQFSESHRNSLHAVARAYRERANG
jgi:hypothetical protein